MKRARSARSRGERGSAAIELLGYLPIMLILLLGAVQLTMIGFTAESAADAARAGARAASKGSFNANNVARQALSPGLRDDASMQLVGETFRVTVQIPVIIPGVESDSRWRLTRSATMPGGLF